jgi:hypothetical protein
LKITAEKKERRKKKKSAAAATDSSERINGTSSRINGHLWGGGNTKNMDFENQ